MYPKEFLPLDTTHSPGFLGLHPGKDGFWSRSGFNQGVILQYKKFFFATARMHCHLKRLNKPAVKSIKEGTNDDHKKEMKCTGLLMFLRHWTVEMATEKMRRRGVEEQEGVMNGSHMLSICNGYDARILQISDC
ncbi:hypothetical protein ACQ4PT_054343 [Festuca glaucescens]